MRIFPPKGVFFAAALCCLASSACADWIRDFKLEGLYNDNLSRSDRHEEKRDDFAATASARIGCFDQTGSLRLSLTLDLESEVWARFDAFDNISAGATAAARYKFGLGARAPFIRLEGSARYADFREDLQDGARYRTVVAAGKRLTERLAVELAYTFDRAAARARLFDQDGHAFSIQAAFDLTSSTQLTAGCTLRRGEVISYARPPRSDVEALANTKREVDTFGELRTAYNFDATSHRLSVGLHQALTSTLGITLRYEWQETSRSHLQYINNVLVAGFHLSF